MYGGRTLLSVHDNPRPVDEGTSYIVIIVDTKSLG